ncbi:hypothetical protein MCOR02_012001 [Pyricularia oryzae]|nr:hypothetical protein MCOR02_012001 [Pyricularia oryzae]
MHLVRGLVLLALAGASAALRPRAEPVEESSPGGSKTFIVELTKGCDVESARQELQRRAPGSKVRKTFESDVFTGLSVETTDHNVESIVRGLGDAVRAWPMRMVPNPAPIVGRSFTAEEGPAAAANYSLHKAARSRAGTTWQATGLPRGPRQPDEDPREPQRARPHVAGILAGKTDSFVGVAPGATLLAYKVFGSGDGAFEDILIDAFLMAYKDGADVITASIGGVGGLARRGPFFASTGASGKNVISIASAEGGDLAAEPFVVTIGGTNESTFGYVPSNAAWNITTMPVVPTSLNTSVTDDACSPLPADFPSLDGAVALIRRGGCDYAVKQRNAEAAGARFVLLALVDVPGGEAMVRAYAANQTVTVDFSRKPSHKVGVFNAAGGLPNAFTSWARSSTCRPSPTWQHPAATSSAPPSTAAGRTLHGAALGRAVHRRIVSSGAALPWSTTDPLRTGVPNNDFGFFAPPAQVGSGMVNATKVVEYGTTIDFEPFALNDTPTSKAGTRFPSPTGATRPSRTGSRCSRRAPSRCSSRSTSLDSVAADQGPGEHRGPVHIVPEVAMPDPSWSPRERPKRSFSTFPGPRSA